MLERKRNENLIRNRLVALLVACYFLFAYFIFLPVKPVYASETLQHHYETSGVIEDLKELKISENARYDTVKMLYFLEYGYGYDGLYSIYIYTYIPLNNTSISNIIYDSPKNAITFGFTDIEEDVLRVDYHKLKISTKGINEDTDDKVWTLENKDKTGVFVKWKVDLSDNDFILSNCAERYYCVSGVELHEERNPTATEFLVGNIYKCFNENGEDKVITSENLPTVSVDTYHTFYRTGVNRNDTSLNSGWQDQISSCYFSLPEYIGNVDTSYLSSIKAEFDYRYTTPILILDGDDDGCLLRTVAARFAETLHGSVDYSNNLYFYANLDYEYSTDSIVFPTSHCYSYDFDLIYKLFNFGRFLGDLPEDNFFEVYNRSFSYDYSFNNLGWFFPDSNLNNYIKDNKITEDYFFDGDNLLNYYYKYKDSPKIKDYLFEQVSNSAENKYSLVNVKYGKNILSYGENKDISKITFANLKQNSNGTFWENLGNALSTWWASLFSQRAYDIEEICPFEKVNYSDIYSLTDEELSNKYFVDINEISSFRTYCEENKLINKEVWLFRYDASNYYSNTVSCFYHDDSTQKTHTATGFIARQPIYLGFDIIEFGFNQDGKEFVIPAIHSPKDVFNDLTAQQDVDYSFLTNFLSSIMMLLFLLALVVLVIVCWPFFKLVFNGAGLIIKGALKIVFLPAKIIFRKRPKNDDDS